MDNRPIGVFDSGLGGLTAVRKIIEAMPGEDVIYFGDTGRVPYGNRSKETIITYTKDDIDFLLKHNVKLVIAACGTASSVALPYLTDKYEVKIMGVLEETCAEAVKSTKNNRIGIIGTQGTIKSGKYEEIIKSKNPDIKVYSVACPMFVPLVENGYANSEAARLIAKDYLTCLKNEKVDTLVLGCTHYPLLEGVISDIMGKEVTLISSGEAVARGVREFLESTDKKSSKKDGGVREFFVSDSVENFSNLGSIFLGTPIDTHVHRAEVPQK